MLVNLEKKKNTSTLLSLDTMYLLSSQLEQTLHSKLYYQHDMHDDSNQIKSQKCNESFYLCVFSESRLSIQSNIYDTASLKLSNASAI